MTVTSTDFGLYKKHSLKKSCRNWQYIIPSLAMFMFLLLGTIFLAATAKKRITIVEKMARGNLTQSENLFMLESRSHLYDNPIPFKRNFNFGAEKPPESFKVVKNKPTPFTKNASEPKGKSSFPRSIQDIIQSLATNNPAIKIIPNNEVGFEEKSTRKQATEHNITGNGFHMEDPFHNFKPNTPGDVNLLAIASVRFAQPVWQSFSSVGAQKLNFGQKHHHQYVRPPPSYNGREPPHIVKPNGGSDRPLAITLNIFGDHSLKNVAERLVPTNEEFGKRKIKTVNQEDERLTINLKIVPEIRHHGTPVK